MCLHEGYADGKLAAQGEKCFVFVFSGESRETSTSTIAPTPVHFEQLYDNEGFIYIYI